MTAVGADGRAGVAVGRPCFIVPLVAIYGAPGALRLDNGPEWVSEALRAWAAQHGVRLLFIQPGKPTQNAYIERFNGTYRTEDLDAYIFGPLANVSFERNAGSRSTTRGDLM